METSINKVFAPEKLTRVLARVLLRAMLQISDKVSRIIRDIPEVPFRKEQLKQILNSNRKITLRYSQHVSMSIIGSDVYMHIGYSQDFSRNPFLIREAFDEILALITALHETQEEGIKPIQIILNSFWLRRKRVKSELNIFLKDLGLVYSERKSGALGIRDYVEYFAMLSAPQFHAIREMGIETGTIRIAGKKDPVLDILRNSALSPAEMAYHYNRMHGLVLPTET